MLSFYESTRWIKEHNPRVCENKAAKTVKLKQNWKSWNVWLYSHLSAHYLKMVQVKMNFGQSWLMTNLTTRSRGRCHFNAKTFHSEGSVLFGSTIPMQYFKGLQEFWPAMGLYKPPAKLKSLQNSESILWVSLCKLWALASSEDDISAPIQLPVPRLRYL